MKKLLLVLVVCVATACDSATDPMVGAGENSLIERAKVAVVERVPDPNSTEFRNVNTRDGYVCGELNTKNRMGAYDGYQFFAYREVSNGSIAWETLGFIRMGPQMGNRIWGANGCLFPQINSCNPQMIAYPCMNHMIDSYIEQGYPANELMPRGPHSPDANSSVAGGFVDQSSAIPDEDTRPINHGLAATIGEWAEANSQCRGGSGDNPATLAACDQRDRLFRELSDSGLCYDGDDIEQQWRWCD